MAEGISLPGIMQRGGSESCLEVETDGTIRDGTRPRLGLDSLQQKILKVTEQLRIEQALRDENVAEYLKLIDTADKQQSSRIKHVFEKKNQKSAQTITQLQRKLEQYHRKMKECDTVASLNGTKQAQVTSKDKEAKDASRDSLKDCFKEPGTKACVRNQQLDKVKTVGPGVSLSPPFFFNKSRGFASLIRNKFGSADNIAHLKSTMEAGGGLRAEGAGRALSGSATLTSKPKYPSDDECSTGTSASAESSGHGGQAETGQVESVSRLSDAMEEVRELREAQGHLTEDIESLRSQAKRNYGFISQMLQEERYR